MSHAEYGKGALSGWSIIYALSLAIATFGQPDVIFTAEPCSDRAGGSYAAVPHDPYHYKQCGPAGFYWILPCAPETYFNADARACVPSNGAKSDQRVDAGRDKADEKAEHSADRLVAAPNAIKAVNGGAAGPPAEAEPGVGTTATRHWAAAYDRGASSSANKAAPGTGPTRQPPVRIVIGNQNVHASQPAAVAGTGEKEEQSTSIIDAPAYPRQEEETGRQPAAPPVSRNIQPYHPYPYPPYPYSIPTSALSGHPAQPPSELAIGPRMAPGPPPPPPPPMFLLAPMAAPRPTAEPEPPRSVSVVRECVENGTCENEEDGSMDTFCPHDSDPTMYFVCSPHPETSGVWVVQQCPAGLHFIGDRCDRPARVHSAVAAGGRNQPRVNGHNNKTTQGPPPAAAVVATAATRGPVWPPPPPASNLVQPPSSPDNNQQQQRVAQVVVGEPSPNSDRRSMLSLPTGAEFVIEPNSTPGPPWQYAIVNSAGVVQIHQGPPPPPPSAFERIPAAPPSSSPAVGQPPTPKAAPWYIRQPPPLEPATSIPSDESALSNNPNAFPTPPPSSRILQPPAAPSTPAAAKTYPPNWSNNLIFPLATPPSTGWPHPPAVVGQESQWQDRNAERQNQPQPVFPQQQQQNQMGTPRTNSAKTPAAASSLSPDQLLAIQQQQQQQQQQVAQGMRVVPAIPGSRVAPNQLPSLSAYNHQVVHSFPYGWASGGRSSIGDQQQPYSHYRETSLPAPASSSAPTQRTDAVPQAEPKPWFPTVGQRCSLLAAPKAQLFANPASSRSFYMCLPPQEPAAAAGWPSEAAEGLWTLMECPEDTLFNALLKVCDKSHPDGKAPRRRVKI